MSINPELYFKSAIDDFVYYIKNDLLYYKLKETIDYKLGEKSSHLIFKYKHFMKCLIDEFSKNNQYDIDLLNDMICNINNKYLHNMYLSTNRTKYYIDKIINLNNNSNNEEVIWCSQIGKEVYINIDLDNYDNSGRIFYCAFLINHNREPKIVNFGAVVNYTTQYFTISKYLNFDNSMDLMFYLGISDECTTLFPVNEEDYLSACKPKIIGNMTISTTNTYNPNIKPSSTVSNNTNYSYADLNKINTKSYYHTCDNPPLTCACSLAGSSNCKTCTRYLNYMNGKQDGIVVESYRSHNNKNDKLFADMYLKNLDNGYLSTIAIDDDFNYSCYSDDEIFHKISLAYENSIGEQSKALLIFHNINKDAKKLLKIFKDNFDCHRVLWYIYSNEISWKDIKEYINVTDKKYSIKLLYNFTSNISMVKKMDKNDHLEK